MLARPLNLMALAATNRLADKIKATNDLEEATGAVLASSSSSSILLVSTAFFIAQYAVAWSVCYKHWRGAKRLRACSCTISFTHSLVTSALAVYELYTTPWQLSAPNSSTQNRIMEWSMGYFLVDLLHYVLAATVDPLFVAHHVATLVYLVSCRFYAGAGAKSVVCLLAAGEITTPLQSIWTLSLLRRDDSRLAEQVYNNLSPVFTVAFTVVRGVIGPYLWWELVKFYGWKTSGGGDAVPGWLAFGWMVIVTAGLMGSAVWGYKLWSGLFKFYLQRLRILRSSTRGRRYDD